MEPALKELFDTLYLSASGMTSGQLEFVDNCKKQFRRNGTISDKQLSVLNDIKKSLTKITPRYTMKVN